MSYINMDHAAWVENNIGASKTLAHAHPKNKRFRKFLDAPDTLTDFQKRVCDILGIVGKGIYNAPISHDSIDWSYGKGVSVVWTGDLATFDFNDLTWLVFLCHEARIRCCIDSAGPRRLRISFWQRKADGRLHERHPNLDEAVADFHAAMPADHRIMYRDVESVAPKEVA